MKTFRRRECVDATINGVSGSFYGLKGSAMEVVGRETVPSLQIATECDSGFVFSPRDGAIQTLGSLKSWNDYYQGFVFKTYLPLNKMF